MTDSQAGSRLEKVQAWLRLRLIELREGVESSLGELGSDEHHHLADLEELASDVGADGVIFEQFRSSSDTIDQIEKALSRIDAGDYEVCEDCGEQIGEERLEALPFATQCVECKRLGESAEGM